MYKKFLVDELTGLERQFITRLSDNAFIPFDPANTDYQAFKQDIAEGKTLQDADGNEMTAEQIKELLDTLE